jgi:hypothetical protein
LGHWIERVVYIIIDVGVRVQPRDAVNRGTGSSVVEDDRTGSSDIEEDGMTQVAAVDFQRGEG